MDGVAAVLLQKPDKTEAGGKQTDGRSGNIGNKMCENRSQTKTDKRRTGDVKAKPEGCCFYILFNFARADHVLWYFADKE